MEVYNSQNTKFLLNFKIRISFFTKNCIWKTQVLFSERRCLKLFEEHFLKPNSIWDKFIMVFKTAFNTSTNSKHFGVHCMVHLISKTRRYYNGHWFFLGNSCLMCRWFNLEKCAFLPLLLLLFYEIWKCSLGLQ